MLTEPGTGTVCADKGIPGVMNPPLSGFEGYSILDGISGGVCC
jgi:hypothetical protein